MSGTSCSCEPSQVTRTDSRCSNCWGAWQNGSFYQFGSVFPWQRTSLLHGFVSHTEGTANYNQPPRWLEGLSCTAAAIDMPQAAAAAVAATATQPPPLSVFAVASAGAAACRFPCPVLCCNVSLTTLSTCPTSAVQCFTEGASSRLLSFEAAQQHEDQPEH